MDNIWTTGPAKELVAALRIGGWVQGQSGLHHRLLRLHKTDLIADLRDAPEGWRCIWRIGGDPKETRTLAKDRRSVIVWLGK